MSTTIQEEHHRNLPTDIGTSAQRREDYCNNLLIPHNPNTICLHVDATDEYHVQYTVLTSTHHNGIPDYDGRHYKCGGYDMRCSLSHEVVFRHVPSALVVYGSEQAQNSGAPMLRAS